MVVLLDTNVYLSALLDKSSQNTISKIVERCIWGEGETLIVPIELLAELQQTYEQKSYLNTHISQEAFEYLILSLREYGLIPEQMEELMPLTRDPNDDYLLAYALSEDVDYLVTGDKDLTSLGQVDTVKIVTPGHFWGVLDQYV